MDAAIHVIATGARTPLGPNGAAAAAAVRAAISSCGEHPFMVDQAGEPMPASLDPALDPTLPLTERMLAMATAALQEACAPFTSNAPWPTPLPLLLALPEARPGITEADAHRLCSRLAYTSGLPVDIGASRAFMTGHASALSALDLAARELRESRCEACIVGGVDSYFHPDTMEWLDRNRQLLGSVSRSGFVPGEGAGFCVLMTAAARQRCGFSSCAGLLASATGNEEKCIKTDTINLGEGLTRTVGQTLAGLAPEDRVDAVICDVNGEHFRGEEWGFTCLKLGHHFRNPTGYQAPADCWGDMGAASGALFLMLACEAAARGHGSGGSTLLWAGSEQGLRAAALFNVPNQPNRFRS